ncbi:MAG: helix-turn-helix transcriptional regulator [Halieaceae bacterium]
MRERRQLTDKELDIAARINSIWQAKKAKEKITQADVNRELGWTSSVFSQYLTGKMALGLDSLVKLCNYLGVSPYDVDPDLAKRFPAPPAEFRDLEAELSTLSEGDTKRLLKALASRLPPEEVANLIEILLDRIKARL